MRDLRAQLLEGLIDGRARVAGEILEVHRGVWAIHGSIPFEGEVIMAEFALLDEARAVLDGLEPNRDGP